MWETFLNYEIKAMIVFAIKNPCFVQCKSEINSSKTFNIVFNLLSFNELSERLSNGAAGRGFKPKPLFNGDWKSPSVNSAVIRQGKDKVNRKALIRN